MNNSKLKIIIIVGIVLVLVIGLILYLAISRKENNSDSGYPEAVQKVIDNPIDKNENWSTIIDNSSFQISYSTGDSGDSFFITISGQPVLESAIQAETALLEKFGNTDKDYICSIPIIINVLATTTPELSGYNFGLSFCPDRIHVTDVEFSEAEGEPVDNNNTNIRGN